MEGIRATVEQSLRNKYTHTHDHDIATNLHCTLSYFLEKYCKASPVATSGHFFSPMWLRKLRRLVLKPMPQVTEHSLQGPQALVAHTPDRSSTGGDSSAAAAAESPLQRGGEKCDGN